MFSKKEKPTTKLQLHLVMHVWTSARCSIKTLAEAGILMEVRVGRFLARKIKHQLGGGLREFSCR